jgi:hypothetical protein
MLVNLLVSALALQPSSLKPPLPSGRPALRENGTPTTLLMAAEKTEGASGSSGEKITLALVAIAVGYGLGALGVTPSGVLAAPGAIVSSPILKKAAKKAIGGGLSGALAGVAQVITLMWMRTTMNYQYRYGTGTFDAMKALYAQGGIARFYQGVTYAIFQTPLSRFGDTAANTGVLELLAMTEWGAGMPIAYKTAMASAAGSLWRIGITPLDTLKTTMQVEGAKAVDQLAAKVKTDGITVLYQGALANAAASFVGSYPWFFTFNLAMKMLPPAPAGDLFFKLLRSAVSGIIASFVSDVFSNFLRVLKTTRQTAATTIGYREAAMMIIEQDGVLGLFTRGLGTRVMTNALQASLFTVVWKYLEGRMNA